MNDTPPPLAPLQIEVIDPRNEALKNRAREASKLSFFQRMKIKRTLATLMKKFPKGEFQVLASKRDEIVKSAIGATSEQKQALIDEWLQYQKRYKQLNAIYKQIVSNQVALNNHALAVKRERDMAQIEKLMIAECKIYENIIIDKWSFLGFKHRYQKGKKMVTHKPEFSERVIAMDAIYYKINASYESLFAGYKTALPEGVKVVDGLLAPSTLSELTIACQRQVTGEWGTNGAWVIVHRLQSVDGLMNYVKYHDVMNDYPQKEHVKMPICIGVGINRTTRWITLSDFPHWLIAGYSGAGKSNMVNVAISTLISQQTPNDLRLVLIDLKGGLEFSYYDGIPHLEGAIVDDISGVVQKLAELVNLMSERFKKFRGVAKRIEEYHLRKPNEYMPRVVCVFDEVASIMSQGETTKEIMNHLRTLTRMGRAVGVHIVLCTQRPDVKAIDGGVKANLAVRISGRMASGIDSRTVLGTSAAKDLAPIEGRMLLQIGAEPEPLQTPHITQDDLEDALRLANQMRQAPPLITESLAVKKSKEHWTPERLIELAITHLDGNIGGVPIYNVLKADGNVTRDKIFSLVEQIHQMEKIVYNDIEYAIVKKARGSFLRAKTPKAQNTE